MSSRGLIKAQGKVSLSKINDAIKQSLHILINSIPPRQYWKFILKGYSRGSSNKVCQLSMLHKSTLATTFIQYMLDSSRPTFQSYTMGRLSNPVQFPIWKGFQTTSQARAQAIFPTTPRASLHGTPAVPQLRAHLDRGPNLEGSAPSRKEERGPRRSISFSAAVGSFPKLSRTTFKGPGEDFEEGEENSVEEEESNCTEGVPAPVWNPSLLEG
ncbi:hypothetical protein O181_099397 [Austropuccinia psidii MF-1]|uniref:Uncharacterized protein n=1 Tax=Austropuccinia psidii MF-1 TaxID=1389203 RepID=A0A9Q3JD68_9BASI|nr:hypothetical protein [Austropuccinia psidii MF-1]